ncbi:pseudouridine synthase [Geomicrobium sediminis]|uniref:Pseudouridine synthase n=1 Tax=Geomicrobium sediminis TaxID=1347788 RepID=A0ABS2P997_9BACL|nr:pseudouridine synthase [Geomicrobium sediminis]MBM7631887.1 16S rRNA pseudouridine516 synthase [Geomicrobium sediminis]
MSESSMRIDKFLANANVGSRSDVKKLIKKKLVLVNELVVSDASFKVDALTDEIQVNGKSITLRTSPSYYVMNKRSGVVTATKDRLHKTVMDDLHVDLREQLFPVGRLDKDTEGLLLLTSDGDFAHRLTSPKHDVEKEYAVGLDALPIKEDLLRIEDGLKLKDGSHTKPAKITTSNHPDYTLHITITEGKYHQVKRMFGAIGHKVERLKRVRIGSLSLDDHLAAGEYRELTTEEIDQLK